MREYTDKELEGCACVSLGEIPVRGEGSGKAVVFPTDEIAEMFAHSILDFLSRRKKPVFSEKDLPEA